MESTLGDDAGVQPTTDHFDDTIGNRCDPFEIV
jgi:hypothetical protein